MEIQLKSGSKIALAAIPPSQVIAKAVSSKETVIVSLKNQNIVKNIFIKDGKIVFANSNDATDHVKNLLLDEKKLSSSQIAEIEKKMVQEKKKFLDTTVEMGYFPQDKLDALKSRHAAFIATKAQGMIDGIAEIVKSDSIFAKIPICNLDTYKIVCDGIKKHINKESIMQFLPDLANENFMIITDKGKNDEILNAVPPESKGVVTIVKASPNIQETITSSFLSEEDVLKNMYFLKIFGLVDIETPETRQGRILDKSLSDEDKKLKFTVLNTFENLKAQTYYEILAVLEDAPQNELDEALEKANKKHDPAKYRKLFWGQEKNVPDDLIGKFKEAYDVLSDVKKRREYDSFVARGEAQKFTQESTVLGSDQALQKAKEAVGNNDYIQAIKFYTEAYNHTPNNTDIMCDLANAIFNAGGPANVKSANEACELLKKAHTVNANNYRIFHEFGKIFTAMNKADQATDSFKKALFLNPYCSAAGDAISKQNPETALATKIRGLNNCLDKLHYYELLDIPVDSSSDSVKKAYYKATKKFHPDKHFTTDSEELKKMTNSIYKRIVEAYMVLKNPTKRKEYDDQLGQYSEDKEMRLKDASDVVQKKEKQEIVFQSKNARKFFELGLTSLAQKKLSAAKMNFQFALQAEPNNVNIKRKLKEVDDLEKGE